MGACMGWGVSIEVLSLFIGVMGCLWFIRSTFFNYSGIDKLSMFWRVASAFPWNKHTRTWMEGTGDIHCISWSLADHHVAHVNEIRTVYLVAPTIDQPFVSWLILFDWTIPSVGSMLFLSPAKFWVEEWGSHISVFERLWSIAPIRLWWIPYI